MASEASQNLHIKHHKCFAQSELILHGTDASVQQNPGFYQQTNNTAKAPCDMARKGNTKLRRNF